MADETPCPDSATLLRLQLGQIPEPQAAQLRDHVVQCPRCSQVPSLQKVDSVSDAVADPALPPVPPDALPGLPDGWDSNAATAKVGSVPPLPIPPEVDPQSLEDVGPSVRLMLRPPEGSGELGRLGDYR